MITKINTNISKKTNKRIIDLLYDVNTWCFGYDKDLSKNLHKPNSGFIYKSYEGRSGADYFNHDCLNTSPLVRFYLQKSSIAPTHICFYSDNWVRR